MRENGTESAYSLCGHNNLHTLYRIPSRFARGFLKVFCKNLEKVSCFCKKKENIGVILAALCIWTEHLMYYIIKMEGKRRRRRFPWQRGGAADGVGEKRVLSVRKKATKGRRKKIMEKAQKNRTRLLTNNGRGVIIGQGKIYNECYL